MKWVLLWIVISGGDAFTVTELGRYDTMIKCFDEREYHLFLNGSTDGLPPVNQQFVCVRTDYE